MTRRRTVRRPRSRRSPPRRSGRQPDLLVALLVAAVGVAVAVTVVQWLLRHWWLLAIAAPAGLCASALWIKQRAEKARWQQVQAQALRFRLSQLDGLHHRDFEFAIRDLMRRDGCTDSVQVGGAGDGGADVKATDPFGRRWVIQCKHRRKGAAGAPVGTPDLHVLNGTGRQLHAGDVVVLVTNGRFTAGCAPLARSQRLHLVDRRTLGEWAAGSRPLWELLQRLPPPRKPTALG
ncbi:restriction system protein [Streptomyces sp. WMMB 714]|nr:restriction system protein [Streptomyces sp. WMMB 714]